MTTPDPVSTERVLYLYLVQTDHVLKMEGEYWEVQDPDGNRILRSGTLDGIAYGIVGRSIEALAALQKHPAGE